ncbi:hypothetical protein IE53DRAFT_308619, partial [Violaceomyces palustris]
GRDWGRVLFSDESSLERYHHRFITPTFRSGRMTLMVWAGIARDFKSPLFWAHLVPGRLDGWTWGSEIINRTRNVYASLWCR